MHCSREHSFPVCCQRISKCRHKPITNIRTRMPNQKPFAIIRPMRTVHEISPNKWSTAFTGKISAGTVAPFKYATKTKQQNKFTSHMHGHHLMSCSCILNDNTPSHLYLINVICFRFYLTFWSECHGHRMDSCKLMIPNSNMVMNHRTKSSQRERNARPIKHHPNIAWLLSA